MPSFGSHGSIWLECDGKRMREYGETRGSDADGRPTRTCYVELVPGATFAVHWRYNFHHASLDGCDALISVDGIEVDKVATLWEDGTLRDCSNGRPLGDHTVAPYKFKRCLLADESSNKGVIGVGSVVCRVTPFKKGQKPGNELGSYEASTQPVYNTDSKAAVVGYSVGYGSAQQSRKYAPIGFSQQYLDELPSFSVTFRYRTQGQLVAMGFIKEAPIQQGTRIHVSSGPSRRPLQVKVAQKLTQSSSTRTNRTRVTDQTAVQLQQARMRMAQQQKRSASRTSEEDIKPMMRIDAPRTGRAKQPLKISLDMTGDDVE